MLKDILSTSFLDNRISDYILFILIFIAGILVIRILKNIILSRLKKWASKTTTTLDDFLIHACEKILIPLLYFGIFYLSLQNLNVNPSLIKVIQVLGIGLLTFFGIRFAVSMLSYIIDSYLSKKEADTTKTQGIKVILPVLKVVIWGIGITFLLDNLGFKISTVIAGLGIGGVAVALAAQAILGDLFSYFAILFDRPFEIGDFIIIGDCLGVVEHIGIKTTRIRSLGGEQLVFSNSDLTNSRVRNYKRMERRRVVFKLGVTYQTTLQQLKEIPIIIANIIKNTKNVEFDRVHFFSYGDFSLIFEIVYYVLSSDYNKYMDVQQEINFAIKEGFEKQKIEFAYPTQTLYLTKT
ncbi:MAG: mechanosensitive ion channel protein MscS [Elusimicrobia bacterium CG1_02_37_114]|nr:MAG: mechanosensitive ion channel protein MscS [Elusimicrobia bacterium CG1_02_37_114]PIV52777.1 MAG: mechanosensitive ion channel protein MscS [Elusimicrobia bacterium CG02_land_8_20_14_3_00_37_13]